MNRIHLLSGFLLVLFFSSCQKGIVWDLDEEEVKPQAGLLSRRDVEVTVGGDKVNATERFFWDNSKRITEYNLSQKSGSETYTDRYRFTRGTDGKVVKAVEDYTGDQTNSSVIRDVYYKNGQLSYMISTEYPASGGSSKDSTVFTYTGTGKIASKTIFAILFGQYVPFTKEEYSYDARGNLSTYKILVTNGTGFAPYSSQTFTYGALNMPAQLGEEVFLVSLDPSFCSPNYYLKSVLTDNTGTTMEANFTPPTELTAANQPVKGKYTMGGATYSFTCTYQ